MQLWMDDPRSPGVRVVQSVARDGMAQILALQVAALSLSRWPCLADSKQAANWGGFR